jgi:flagellar protein FliS
MNPNGAQNYLRTKVLTATPEQLQLMLFDGAVRFADQGREALVEKNFEQVFLNFSRAQKIVNQLICALNRDVDPELCDRLAGIYKYVYRKLVEASVEHKLASAEEAISLLNFQRETWVMLMEKLGKQKATAAAKGMDIPSPDARMEASISMQG